MKTFSANRTNSHTSTAWVGENSSRPRLLGLDGLRGFAAIYVVLFHTDVMAQPNLLPSEMIARPVVFGGTGVLLFFVISGFSLSMTMPRHQRATSQLLSYAISRLFRICPLYYAMLAVSLLLDWLWFNSHIWPANLAANLIFVFNFVPHWQEGIVWASWTLGVEMVYYLAFPFIYTLSVSWKVAIAILSAVMFWSMTARAFSR